MLLHQSAHLARQLKTTDRDHPEVRVLAYVQEDEAIGGALETAVVAACLRRGWELVILLRDDDDDPERPGLRLAFDRLVAREASGLVVPGLDHLAPTLAELEPYLDWFLATNTALVAIAEGLDTSTRAGEAAALRLAHLGAIERRMADLRHHRTAQVISVERYLRDRDRRRRVGR
jgi:hypothetical protein